MKNTPADQTNITPGVIVLQWLTYAFWGLTVLATSVLATTVIAYFITPSNNNDFSAYATAAVLVLLPISVVCDIFYSKREPQHKTGASSIIMIIHAVVFALFGIGAIIGIVFSLVQLLISSSDITGTRIALYSEIVIVFLYAVTFLRTLLPVKLVKFRQYYPIFMIVVAGIISVLSFIGPVANAQLTRNDKLIDNNLYSIQSGVDIYVNSQNKLPADLNSLDLTGDAKKIVDENLVKYTANSKPSAVTSSTFNPSTSTTTFYYKLCVDYKAASNNSNGVISMPTPATESDGYNSYIPSSSHPAGNYCYKLSSVTGFIGK